jgi:hypothetical protein
MSCTNSNLREMNVRIVDLEGAKRSAFSDLLLLKELPPDDWEDIDMIRKCSLIMYEHNYCAMRLRCTKTKEKLERDLWGDKKGHVLGRQGHARALM